MAFGLRFFPLGVAATTLTPNKYTNTNTFNTHTIRAVHSFLPSLYTNSQTFRTPAVLLDNPIAAPFLIDGNQFFSPHASTRYDQGKPFSFERRKITSFRVPLAGRWRRS